MTKKCPECYIPVVCNCCDKLKKRPLNGRRKKRRRPKYDKYKRRRPGYGPRRKPDKKRPPGNKPDPKDPKRVPDEPERPEDPFDPVEPPIYVPIGPSRNNRKRVKNLIWKAFGKKTYRDSQYQRDTDKFGRVLRKHDKAVLKSIVSAISGGKSGFFF